ncbi:hypothetical protein [Robiginitomaculum antarcticum]|uniref:hypothetical protein n=1 Tax=Robiginitomaculum antarcticum TaxID=437507 RepID=UPI000374641D|nr:hypothetical protein [Robiginitomaculum antarcticum]
MGVLDEIYPETELQNFVSEQQQQFKPSKKSKLRRRFEKELVQSVMDLCAMNFGSFWGERDKELVDDPKDAYDKDYWEVTPQIEYSNGNQNVATWYGLSLKANKRHDPALAINAILQKKDIWKIDCAIWSQLCLILAQLRMLGNKKFNKIYGNKLFLIRQHGASAIERGSIFDHGQKFSLQDIKIEDDIFYRLRPSAKIHDTSTVYTTKQIKAFAKNGYRFTFRNWDASPGEDFQYENALWLGKDQYAAFGFKDENTCVYTERELKNALANITYSSGMSGEQETLNAYADRVVTLVQVEFLNASL